MKTQLSIITTLLVLFGVTVIAIWHFNYVPEQKSIIMGLDVSKTDNAIPKSAYDCWNFIKGVNKTAINLDSCYSPQYGDLGLALYLGDDSLLSNTVEIPSEPNGNYFVMVVADEENEITESLESNNGYVMGINISSQADNVPEVKAGEKIPIWSSVSNGSNLPIYDKSRIEQDFVAMKLGDVNEDWVDVYKLDSVGEVTLNVNLMKTNNTYEVVVPIIVKNFNPMVAYQFCISWNPSIVESLEVVGQSISGYQFESSMNKGINNSSAVTDTSLTYSLTPATDGGFMAFLKYRAADIFIISILILMGIFTKAVNSICQDYVNKRKKLVPKILLKEIAKLYSSASSYSALTIAPVILVHSLALLNLYPLSSVAVCLWAFFNGYSWQTIPSLLKKVHRIMVFRLTHHILKEDGDDSKT